MAKELDCDLVLLAVAPSSCSAREAAALLLATITTWEAKIDNAKNSDSMSVMAHGGTGGVLYVAVQIAVARGATVAATVSSVENADLATTVGIATINHNQQEVANYLQDLTAGEGFRVSFNTEAAQISLCSE